MVTEIGRLGSNGAAQAAAQPCFDEHGIELTGLMGLRSRFEPVGGGWLGPISVGPQAAPMLSHRMPNLNG